MAVLQAINANIPASSYLYRHTTYLNGLELCDLLLQSSFGLSRLCSLCLCACRGCCQLLLQLLDVGGERGVLQQQQQLEQ
jgi:hypothetical protein